ncbi:DUF2584 family protein [Leptolyngbya sp. FACHB-36]|uniref:DUF2584 family protein n=1 Tax=Leptolyngbya sp. FACHB-36 TaxID=2692808 RepID=UPI001681BEEB|nr:DUF2584 family protein [Leptolyngbya sp. FACHB-36]MBD2021580.1 DUF2584 family protein [Leptolyngbya sp. FACHB-36]
MGMPCQVNSIVRLKRSQGYPDRLTLHEQHRVAKSGYRIFPLDVPLQLVDDDWIAHADVVIRSLTWENQTTTLTLEVVRLYESPFALK